MAPENVNVWFVGHCFDINTKGVLTGEEE